eukprot:GHVU01118366.1.p2 GENE.GHVU01118366.1~~GHVU01118366.1.p2  ORF type:complete len:101 (+),score=2.18 GHVU01118366.1:48-305(+)
MCDRCMYTCTVHGASFASTICIYVYVHIHRRTADQSTCGGRNTSTDDLPPSACLPSNRSINRSPSVCLPVCSFSTERAPLEEVLQ